MNEPWVEAALSRLRSETGRSGGARRVVVEFLGGRDCCVSAQEIHDGVRAGGARIGIATVYRTLEGLDERGLVQRVDLGDGISRSSAPILRASITTTSSAATAGRSSRSRTGAGEAIAGIAGGRGYEVAPTTSSCAAPAATAV